MGAHDCGYVVSVGRESVLLALVSGDIQCDGYAVLRRADVAEVHAGERERVRDAIIKKRGALPGIVPKFNLDDIAETIRSINKLHVISAVYREYRWKDEFLVGVPICITKKMVRFSYLNTCAKWDGEFRAMLASISKIEFGTIYLTGLASVADDAPNVEHDEIKRKKGK